MKNILSKKSQLFSEETKIKYSSSIWLIILFVILTIVTVSSFNNTAIFEQILTCDIIILSVIILKKNDRNDP
jgi:hypothetical protein